jgi:hypothetical protein
MESLLAKAAELIAQLAFWASVRQPEAPVPPVAPWVACLVFAFFGFVVGFPIGVALPALQPVKTQLFALVVCGVILGLAVRFVASPGFRASAPLVLTYAVAFYLGGVVPLTLLMNAG